jgi:hypothetical protein
MLAYQIRLFPDTKIPENITKNFICCNLTGYFSKIMDSLPDIYCNKVFRDLVFKSLYNSSKAFRNTKQSFIMSYIRDYYIFCT